MNLSEAAMEGRRKEMVVGLFFAMVVAAILLVQAVDARTDPATGRIRLLFVGQWPYSGRPQYLVEDPLLATSVVPYYEFGAQLDEIRRYMNIRYPRTSQFLKANYDVVAFSNIQLPAFTPKQIEMMSEAVVQDGLGYMMSGGHTSFGGTAGSYPSWRGTSIDGILPVDVVDGIYLKLSYRLIVSDPDNVLIKSLPWGGLRPFTYTINRVMMRQGGRLLAESDLGERWPILACGDFGSGRSLVFMTPLNTYDNRNLLEWGFFDDMCANIVYFASQAELPTDPLQVHELRRLFRDYHDQRLLYLSMVEFVDRFGASTAGLEDELSEIEMVRGESYSAYMAREFERSYELMTDAFRRLKEGLREALRVKDAALAWIYLLEWLTVTATLLVASSVLWTLMVRRRLYREPRSTRMLDSR